jgi:hypothetical protein
VGQTVNAPGVTFPRALLSNVGSWTVTLAEEGMSIEAVDSLSLWASSDQGATNVHWRIQIGINGNLVGTLYTETKAALSSTPEEFLIDPGQTVFSPQVFEKGSQLGFFVQYLAGSNYGPVGPSSDSTFHFYHNLYRSRVDFVTNPFNLTLESVKLDRDRINATTIMKDAFGVDMAQKVYSLTFNGPTNSQPQFLKLVSTVVDPVNGTHLVWEWLFASQGGVSDGSYSVTVAAQYAGSEANYSNVSQLDIRFPSVRSGGKGFLPGPDAMSAAAALAVVAVATLSWRRVGVSRRAPDEIGHAPKP